MRVITFVVLSLLIFSCGKDKKQTPAPSAKELEAKSAEEADKLKEDSRRSLESAQVRQYIQRLSDKETPVAHCVMILDSGNGDAIKSHSIFSFENKKRVCVQPWKWFGSCEQKFIVHERKVQQNMQTTLFHKPYIFKISKRSEILAKDFSLEHNDNNELKGLRFNISDEGRSILIHFLKVTGSLNSTTECEIL